MMTFNEQPRFRRGLSSSMREQCKKDDDRDRNAKQPKKNASTHDGLLILLEG